MDKREHAKQWDRLLRDPDVIRVEGLERPLNYHRTRYAYGLVAHDRWGYQRQLWDVEAVDEYLSNEEVA